MNGIYRNNKFEIKVLLIIIFSVSLLTFYVDRTNIGKFGYNLWFKYTAVNAGECLKCEDAGPCIEKKIEETHKQSWPWWKARGVYLPGGDYTIKTTITIQSNTTIRGSSFFKTKLIADLNLAGLPILEIIGGNNTFYYLFLTHPYNGYGIRVISGLPTILRY